MDESVAPVSPAQHERLAALVDRYESAWRSDRQPRIEDVVAELPAPDRSEVLSSLIALELRLRRDSGDPPTTEEYLRRFPEKTELVHSAFASLSIGSPPKSTDPTMSWHSPQRGVPPGGYPRDDPDALPRTIGKYVVLNRLGKGSQGDVFRVLHPTLAGEYVLKWSRKEVDGSSTIRGTLVSEGHTLARLSHPNLARVIDLDFDGNHPFLVMDYLSGRTLHQFSVEDRPAPRQAARLIAKLAHAVGYLHREGVIHQDIKPSNIVIDGNLQPRLIDFGLARPRDAWSDDSDSPIGGTLQFMAPEQARGEHDRIGPASDIFALGAVLYCLLTGHPPFDGRGREEMLVKARRCDFDRAALRRPGIPCGLARIVVKAMADQPEQRHPTADALAQELEKIRVRGVSSTRAVGLAVAALVALALLAWALLHRWWPIGDPGTDRASQAPSTASRSTESPATEDSIPRIVRMELTLLPKLDENRFDKNRVGLVGERSFGARPGDDVRVDAVLSEPAYAYLIAFQPDGQFELCEPDDEAIAPPKNRNPRYPPSTKPEDIYRLDNGTGLQAFALVVSRRPLPPFQEWKPRFEHVPWRAGIPADRGIVWRHDGLRLLPRTAEDKGGTRGKGAKARAGGELDDLAKWLRALPGIDAVAIEAFAVEPRSEK